MYIAQSHVWNVQRKLHIHQKKKKSPIAILQEKVCTIQYIQNVWKSYISTKGIMRDSLEMKQKCKKAKATEQIKGSKAAAAFAF